MCEHGTTVEPPKRDRIGDWMFGPFREVGPISEVFLVCRYNPPHTEHKNNYVTMNFTMIKSQFACTSCGPIGKIILFEVARTYQSYRTSLSLDTPMHRVPCLVCTVLHSYRVRINSLFLGMVSFWVFLLSSGIYSKLFF